MQLNKVMLESQCSCSCSKYAVVRKAQLSRFVALGCYLLDMLLNIGGSL